MSWNYRLILHDASEPQIAWIGLHEVYYDDEGKVETWTKDAVDFSCGSDEGTAGIIRSLKHALKDTKAHSMLIESELLAQIDREKMA